MINQFLKDIEPFINIKENGNGFIKEDDLTSLMCRHALTPDEMGRVHEILALRKIEILPYEYEGNPELSKKIILAFDELLESLDASLNEFNISQKEKIISYAQGFSIKLNQYISLLKNDEQISKTVINKYESISDSFDGKAHENRLSKKSIGFVNKGLIISVLEQLEKRYHNPNGYTTQEMLDIISEMGLDFTYLKNPHASLRGILPSLVSKKLYPEYIKARSEDIIYQPNGKHTGTWRLSKYRKGNP